MNDEKLFSTKNIIWCVLLLICYYGFKGFFEDKKTEKEATTKNKSFNTPNYDDGENLKTQNDVNQYALKRAEYYCGEWAKAQSKLNETNKRNEESIVRSQTLAFSYELRSVLQSNDLPDSYSEGADKVFQDKINACGIYGD